MANASADDVSLREYVDTRFEAQREAVAAALAAQEKAVAAALAAADRAVAKAETAAEKRFESVNEFRSALADNFRTLMPRAEAEAAMKTVNEKIDILTSRVNARDERSNTWASGWGLIVGIVGVVSAVIAIVFALTRGA
jgi:hypothetical protein